MGNVDTEKLWQNFVDTITNHYTDFTGRVGRAQFWYYVLVNVVVGMAVSIVGSIFLTGGALSTLYSLALFLPSLGMTARRLQDTGRPGTWAWLLAVPLAAIALLIFFCAQPGQAGSNDFGPMPGPWPPASAPPAAKA